MYVGHSKIVESFENWPDHTSNGVGWPYFFFLPGMAVILDLEVTHFLRKNILHFVSGISSEFAVDSNF